MASHSSGSGDGPLEDLLAQGIDEGQFSCAVAVVGGRDGPDRTVAVGESDPEAGIRATPDTVFDVASVTKPVGTTTVVLRLIEEDVLDLSDTLGEHVDELADDPRAEVTVEQLLTHTAGLEDYHYDPDWDSPSTALSAIFDAPVLARDPGGAHEYSCLSFVHLAAIVRAVTGESLAELAERLVFAPAGMGDAHLGPLSDPPENTAVTYEHDYEDRRLKGEIHDPIARAMEGESGNAGLFATAGDLSRFARALLSGGTIDGNRLLSAETVDDLQRNYLSDAEDPHSLGWRIAHDGWPAAGWSQLSGGSPAIGHTGYTGTSLWLDPRRDQFAVLLTNAVLEDASMIQFRERFHGLVAEEY